MKSFLEFLAERMLSIGFNPEHDLHREKHRQEIHDMMRNSYKSIGGYSGRTSGSKEESDAIHDDISNHNIKAVKHNGRVVAANIYKDQHGRKSIASATDGSPEGKRAFRQIKHEDNRQKRAWGEVSGSVEAILKKQKHPVVPASRAKELLNKDVNVHPDGEHYDRKIGGHSHTKTIMGHPKTQ